MKALKSHSQIERPHCMKNRVIRVKRTARVLAVMCLTSGLALPIYCRTHHASNHITTQSATNSGWTSTGDLNTGRYAHTATLLPNGKVLVVGGAGPDCFTPTSSAELYEPVSGTWSHTGSLYTARVSHTATLLQNGQVLVAGGSVNHYAPQVFLNSAELYDPATGTWRPTGSFKTIRAGTTFFPKGSATLLPNGKVLVIGASDPSRFVVDSAELYDPDTGTWTSTGAPRVGGTMVLLSNGKVLAVSKGSPWDYNGLRAEVYDPATARWTSTGHLNVIQSVDTVTLLRNGKVLVTSNPQAELYDTNTGTWSITAASTHHTTKLTEDLLQHYWPMVEFWWRGEATPTIHPWARRYTIRPPEHGA